MLSTIMKATKAAHVLPTLASLRGASAEDVNPKGAVASNTTAGFWGVETDAIKQWQAQLGDPDTTGTFTLPGFNISQPWSGAEQLDWTINIAVKANMALPRFDDDENALVVTGGMVWIEPPEGLVTGDNYTANEEWSPSALYYMSAGFSALQPDEPLTPFFHRDPDDDGPANGSCKGILTNECIEYIKNAAEQDYVNTERNSQRIEDQEKCPGISGASRLNLGSPFSLTKRNQDDAAMEYDGGWLMSFSSGEHHKGNGTDYAVHGSQYIPILFRWMRADKEGLNVDEAKPDGKISSLMCVAVNEATDGNKLPDPGQDYLEAVKDKENGKSLGIWEDVSIQR